MAGEYGERTMRETYLPDGDDIMFLRHNDLLPERPTLLFLHGLGSSGLDFEDVFKFRQFDDVNIVIPDLVGYGRSSAASESSGYGFGAHLTRLWGLVKEFSLRDIVLVGHSMGADLTTFMCQADRLGIIRKHVCIESDITQHETFFSRKAADADRAGNFEGWFEHFRGESGYKLLGSVRSGRLYCASLQFCRPEAFRQDSLDLVRRANAMPEPYRSEMGTVYCSLTVPRVFCYGTESLAGESLEFLTQNGMRTEAFEGVGHGPMTDQPDRFYPFLNKFTRE